MVLPPQARSRRCFAILPSAWPSSFFFLTLPPCLRSSVSPEVFSLASFRTSGFPAATRPMRPPSSRCFLWPPCLPFIVYLLLSTALRVLVILRHAIAHGDERRASGCCAS